MGPPRQGGIGVKGLEIHAMCLDPKKAPLPKFQPPTPVAALTPE